MSIKDHATPLRHIRHGDIGEVLDFDQPDTEWLFVSFDGFHCWTLDDELEAVAS